MREQNTPLVGSEKGYGVLRADGKPFSSHKRSMSASLSIVSGVKHSSASALMNELNGDDCLE